ncbi:hypothetical protein BBJ28_00008522 [Nothophytophthora sp. Chile5]|nr:hypothetical protein BBJ28_00008522 [Nothophytophthora sp. Chile5]
MDDTALVRYAFSPNDTVIVATASSSAIAAAPSAPAKRPSRATTKRAAAKKPAVKKAQGGVHSLQAPSTGKKPPTTSKRKITGSGFQLGTSLDDGPPAAASGEAEASDEEQPQRKYRRTRAINLSSKEDVELSLANAVSGRSKGREGKFFRAATKSAVEHQYEMTLANARLRAALSNKFEVQELTTTRRADGSAVQMTVRFKETPRKWKEETVDLLKPDELQAIVKYVLLSGGEAGREMLKPFNMAQVSTRVFWSIARLYGGDVAVGLAELVPDEDWSFLDTRTRAMSEKAMEAKANEEQYKVWKQEKSRHVCASSPELPSRGAKEEAEAKAEANAAVREEEREVVSVDSSGDEEMKQAIAESKRESVVHTPALSAQQATQSSLRHAMAQAALSRFDRSARTNSVVAAFKEAAQSTPPVPGAANELNTESEEELEEATTVYCDSCKKARILSPAEAGKADLDKDPWTCVRLAGAGRSPSCDAVDDEVAQITGKAIAECLLKASVATRRDLADASVASTLHALVDPLDPSLEAVRVKLERLIDEARLDEVNDWMLDIVGDAELVGELELQKLGTPADLLATPSDLIVQAVGEAAELAIEAVAAWQERAQRLVDDHDWLSVWRTL